MDDINVGEKISEYRKAKNLSIRDLAKLTNVTPSLLSQIERGLANPSLNTLKVIAKILEIPLFAFFVTPLNTKELVVRSDKRKKMILPENKNVAYELLSPDLSGAIEFALMKLTPNSNSSEELMEHEGEEVAFVIEGKLNLYIDSNVIVLDTGDSVRIPRGMKHKWENSYKENGAIVFAITPPSF
ncbi:helix-turn-helix domain-containing protein [Clostridium aciditolerans]|uniref:Helix-turn-helix domain-containing protein n=1 Tax=Clostridium aciditolerans TaxID=339861 RepID=A0A934HRH1_9CLOT|nr:helix-turn-helix transcriptional regulator [Clostridium aciditolerans]MBI6871953.1 helix-turn-helix domain-containing protein [Clostridium aciditolerans]